jgi:hypothetical protein
LCGAAQDGIAWANVDGNEVLHFVSPLLGGRCAVALRHDCANVDVAAIAADDDLADPSGGGDLQRRARHFNAAPPAGYR